MRRALRPRAALLLALCLALAAAFPGPAAAQSQPVITIAAGTSPVTEGTAASFTVTASPAPNANLVVNLTVADVPYHRGFLASTTTGAKMVTIPANATSAPYSVPTVNRTRDTASGPVTVTVATGSDYTVGTASSASVRVEDTNPTGATWTISDNSAVEGGTSGNDLGSIEFFLFRNLYPGEALAIPLAFSGAVRGTDFTLALQDDTDGDPPDGVVLSGATLTVTGSDAGSATSGIRVALAALPDADAETETVTVSAGPAAPTGLDGGVSFSQDGTNDEIRLSERTNLLTIERHADVAARVTEGASTTFRIRRAVGGGSYSNGALSVSVSVADAPGADFVASGSQGARTVAMAASDQWKDFSVSTDDDNTDEPSGPVTATLQAVANDFGYAVGDPGAASVYVRDNDGPAEPEVTIAAGSAVTEGALGELHRDGEPGAGGEPDGEPDRGGRPARRLRRRGERGNRQDGDDSDHRFRDLQRGHPRRRHGRAERSGEGHRDERFGLRGGDRVFRVGRGGGQRRDAGGVADAGRDGHRGRRRRHGDDHGDAEPGARLGRDAGRAADVRGRHAEHGLHPWRFPAVPPACLCPAPR